MSTILYEWEFVNYICRVVESEPGIVHFEQARKESGGDPRVMEFRRTATPMGAANEIIQLHQALAEAKMLNRDLAAFYQGYQEDRNRRERELEELKAAYETSHASRVHADEAVLRLEADLEAVKIGNVWRCECCGEMATFADSSFRWAGDRWQHSHPEAQTSFDCRNFGPAPGLSAALKVGVEQEGRIAQLEADLEAERGRRRKTYCAYCGYEEAVDMDSEKIARHIATCEKHPMRKVEADLEAAREVVRFVAYVDSDGIAKFDDGEETGIDSLVGEKMSPAVRAAWEGKS